MEIVDLAGLITGMLLTILILTYFLHDNPLYRLALHLLVGATVGYAAAIVTYTVFLQMVLPSLLEPVGSIERYAIIMPLVLGLLLLLKGFPRSRLVSLGNISTAFLVGVGSAVAVGGALFGTLIPQILALGSLNEWLSAGGSTLINGLVVTLGTICTLLAFVFTVPRHPIFHGLWDQTVGLLGKLGRIFLLIAFGAVFATALTASLSLLISRIYAVIDGTIELIHFFGG
ncbi:MAG: hypothetical protein JW900_00690 [Anaerolineae bacterium]|nr:hypothetical protein [Anaerolineae bacterium]